jgi:hypothetical protein
MEFDLLYKHLNLEHNTYITLLGQPSVDLTTPTTSTPF